jgi:hypothetical protein
VFADLDPSDTEDLETCLQKVSASFAEAKRMLIETAEDMGIDVNAINDEEFAEIRRREKEFVDNDELSHLAERYWRAGREILDNADKLIPAEVNDDDLLADAITVLVWYLFFIPVKVNSGLRGMLDDEGFEDNEQLIDPESYTNGTVKIGLIAIDKSIVAWKKVVEVGGVKKAEPIIALLDTMQNGLENRFPLARDFVRPGFDEAEMVM